MTQAFKFSYVFKELMERVGEDIEATALERVLLRI